MRSGQGLKRFGTALIVCSTAVSVAATATSGQGRAQSLVVPKGAGVAADLAAAEGSGAFHLPSRNAPSRVQIVYRGADLGIASSGMPIAKLAFRRDGIRTTAFRAHRQKMTVHLSATGVALPAEVDGASFSATHGTDRTLVLDKAVVDWPADPRPTQPPAAFSVEVKLTKPFVLAARRNLCVDIAVASESGKPESHYWYVDAADFDRSGSRGSARSYGTGCPATFRARGRVPSLDGESRIQTTATTQWTGGGSALALLLVAANKDKWSGGKLPLALPGASGCKLYIDPIRFDLGRTEANHPQGFVRFQGLRLPKDPAFSGVKFYEQVAVLDPTANALGIRTSNYVAATLGSVGQPLPARMLYHSSSSTVDAPTATVDGGIVLRVSR